MGSRRGKRRASFSHAVERELARVFDEHGIAWGKVRAKQGVTVEVLYGRDFDRLAERSELDALAEAARGEPGHCLRPAA